MYSTRFFTNNMVLAMLSIVVEPYIVIVIILQLQYIEYVNTYVLDADCPILLGVSSSSRG